MTSLLLTLALASSNPAQAGMPYVVDASTAPVELEAVVERGTLDLLLDGQRLSDWDDSLDLENATGGTFELAILDAVDADGTTWTVQVTAWEGRSRLAWERDADGAWALVDGELTWDLVVVAQATTGGKIKYGPVITIKPKG